MTDHPDREALAAAIHAARWPADRQLSITPFEDEDRNGRGYCFRLADGVIAYQAALRNDLSRSSNADTSDLDPADVWDDYCEEVAPDNRSPQGALAFGFWAALGDGPAAPTPHRETAGETIQENETDNRSAGRNPDKSPSRAAVAGDALPSVANESADSSHLFPSDPAPDSDAQRRRVREAIALIIAAKFQSSPSEIALVYEAADAILASLPVPDRAAPDELVALREAALKLLAAEDDRQSKLHDLLETIREQIRLEVAPEHRPDGLFQNIQDAVYAMRGRTPLLEKSKEWWLSRIDNEPDVQISAGAAPDSAVAVEREALWRLEEGYAGSGPFDRATLNYGKPNDDIVWATFNRQLPNWREKAEFIVASCNAAPVQARQLDAENLALENARRDMIGMRKWSGLSVGRQKMLDAAISRIDQAIARLVTGDTNSAPPVNGPHNSGEPLPNSDVAEGGAETALDWKLSAATLKRIEDIDENSRNALINTNKIIAGSGVTGESASQQFPVQTVQEGK